MSTEVERPREAGEFGVISDYAMPGKSKRLLQFVLACWKSNLLGAMEFRVSFLLMAGTMLINDVVWIIFWGLYFRRFPVVNGWELQDVMMLWAVSAGGVGLMSTLFGNSSRIAGLIVSGQLDVYLSQPKPVLLHVLVSRMSVSAIGDVAFSLLVYGFFGDHTAIGLAKFGLALALATLIFIFFTVIANCLAFWSGGTDGLSAQLFNALVTFTTYPTGIFRGVGKLLLFTIVPAGFISYLPIGLLREADPLFMIGVVGVAGVLSAGGIWLFHAGLKRYTSGNMMGLRR
jgi:ABC-2 type transport system permease protein